MAKSLSNIIRAGSPSTPLPVSFGGTGSTTAASSLTALGALPTAGGVMSGDIVFASGQTVANLASGSAGTIPYQSASGTTAMLAAGTSGQVLTSAGAAAPTWSNPSSGAMVLISSVTATAASTVEFLTGISSTYDTYIFDIVGLYSPSGSTTQLLSQLYSGGAYVGGTSYLTHVTITGLGTTIYTGLSYVNQANAKLTNAASVPGSSNAYNGLATLSGVNIGRANLRTRALSSGDNTMIDSSTNIYANTITGIKFFLLAGTMTCTIRMYGISKS